MALNAQISQAYVHTVSAAFEEIIKNRGTALINYITPIPLPIPTYKHAIMQYDGGGAKPINSGSEKVTTSDVLLSKRILMPSPCGDAFSFDGYDSVRAQFPDAGMLAAKLAESMLLYQDSLILNGRNGIGGILGAARTDKMQPDSSWKESFVSLDTSLPPIVDDSPLRTVGKNSNFISWNNLAFFPDILQEAANHDKLPRKSIESAIGLSSGKIHLAVSTLQSRNVPPPYICVASSYALNSFTADERVNSSILNYAGPIFSTQEHPPYDGINWFVTCESVAKDRHSIIPTATHNISDPTVEYAYIFNPQYINIGMTMMQNIFMEQIPGLWRQSLIKTDAMYDVVRTQEKAVMIIEVARLDSDVQNLVPRA